MYRRYVPRLRETRRQVGARGCVERVVRSAQVGARSQGASSLPPGARPSLRCAGNQTPLTHSATTLLPALALGRDWAGISLASRQANFNILLLLDKILYKKCLIQQIKTEYRTNQQDFSRHSLRHCEDTQYLLILQYFNKKQ